jgi:hypothetical protein
VVSILKYILQKYVGILYVDCIYPDRDKDKWVAGDCKGSNEPSGNQIREISRIAKALPECQKRLCPMALMTEL